MSVLLNRARTVAVIWYDQAINTFTEMFVYIWHRLGFVVWEEFDQLTWDNAEGVFSVYALNADFEDSELHFSNTTSHIINTMSINTSSPLSGTRDLKLYVSGTTQLQKRGVVLPTMISFQAGVPVTISVNCRIWCTVTGGAFSSSEGTGFFQMYTGTSGELSIVRGTWTSPDARIATVYENYQSAYNYVPHFKHTMGETAAAVRTYVFTPSQTIEGYFHVRLIQSRGSGISTTFTFWGDDWTIIGAEA